MGQIVICCVYEMPKQRGYFKRDHNKICWTIGQIVHLQQSSISFTSLDSTASLPRYIKKTTYFLCLSCLIFSNWRPAEQWYFPQRWVFFGSTHGYMKHLFSPILKNGPTTASFCLFSSFSNTNYTEKFVRLSRIWTWIVGVESKHSDHFTTTTVLYSPMLKLK